MGKIIKIKRKAKRKKKKVYNKEELDKILEVIKHITHINPFENTRKQEVIEIRSLFINYMRLYENMTYEAITGYFISNGRQMNHATALHSYRNFSLYCRYNKRLEDYFNQILDKFGNGNLQKLQAKRIIENSDPVVAELFLYMYEKTTESI